MEMFIPKVLNRTLSCSVYSRCRNHLISLSYYDRNNQMPGNILGWPKIIFSLQTQNYISQRRIDKIIPVASSFSNFEPTFGGILMEIKGFGVHIAREITLWDIFYPIY